MQFVKYLRYATINAGDHTGGGAGTGTAVEGKPSVDQPNDALDVIFTQDQIIADLFGVWHQASEQLSHADDVDLRWRRGSDVKLLLQHLAVREAAKGALVRRMREAGQEELATKLDSDASSRRERLATLDELARGHQALSLNFPEIDDVVADLSAVFQRERPDDEGINLPEAAALLGPSGKRGLPSARSIRMQSVTHPRPVPRWYDRVPIIKAVQAFYDHLRSAPSGVLNPGVDRAREHLPGPGR
jgi:hypothetical protein